MESDNAKEEVLVKLEKRIDKILLLATSAADSSFDNEKALIELSEMVPFDDASRKRIESELAKQGSDSDRKAFLTKVLADVYESREKQIGKEAMRVVEKFAYLGAIDRYWIEHIDYIDGLQTAVRLRGAAQRDPKAEFKNEAFTAFEGLFERIDEELARRIFRVHVTHQPRPEIPLESARTNVDTSDNTGLVGGADVAAQVGRPAFTGTRSSQIQKALSDRSSQKINSDKIGRNDPCPCGATNPNTGKVYKYKKCGMINAPYHRK